MNQKVARAVRDCTHVKRKYKLVSLHTYHASCCCSHFLLHDASGRTGTYASPSEGAAGGRCAHLLPVEAWQGYS